MEELLLLLAGMVLAPEEQIVDQALLKYMVVLLKERSMVSQ